MDNKIEQIAEQSGMTVEFVTWFFNEKKSACGEHWFLALGAMWEGWKGRSAESTAALATIEKFREIVGCPAGAGLQDHLRKLVADRDEALSAERVWENAMMEVCGEDGPASVANEIRALQGLRDTAMQALKAQVEQLAAENVGLRNSSSHVLQRGEPPKTYRDEWFIARVKGHGFAVLRSLPEEYSYDYTTLDATYFRKDLILEWMQLPNSEFLPNIKTPATDRVVAGIKADGVEQAANECYGAGYICETLLAYAQQLREGADK